MERESVHSSAGRRRQRNQDLFMAFIFQRKWELIQSDSWRKDPGLPLSQRACLTKRPLTSTRVLRLLNAFLTPHRPHLRSEMNLFVRSFRPPSILPVPLASPYTPRKCPDNFALGVRAYIMETLVSSLPLRRRSDSRRNRHTTRGVQLSMESIYVARRLLTVFRVKYVNY